MAATGRTRPKTAASGLRWRGTRGRRKKSAVGTAKLARRVSRPVPEREKGFLQAVRELARHAGWLEFHDHDSRKSTPGFPDLVLVKPPSLVLAELKTARGVLTPAQRVWCAALQACGVEVYVWRPADWPAIVQRLTK